MSLILNGTDNSATTPSVQGSTGGTGTGVYYPATNKVAIATNGTNAITVDSSQNVGIGTTSPSTILQASSGSTPRISVVDTRNSVQTQLLSDDTSGYVGTTTNNNFRLFTNNTNRAIVTNDGSMYIAPIGSNYSFKVGADGANYSYRNTNNAGFGVMHFSSDYYGTATLCSYIQANGTYNNTSDARLKKNITPTVYGLDAVCKLKPVDFHWNQESDNAQKSCGFIAQDVETVIPQAVTTMESDAENTAVENQKMLSVSTLIPALTKAIQELNSKVEAQAAEIAALKAGA